MVKPKRYSRKNGDKKKIYIIEKANIHVNIKIW